MSCECVDLESLVLVSPIPSGSYTLSASFCSSEGRDLKETFCLKLYIPRSLTLFIMSGSGSLYWFPSAARGNFSNDG